MAGTATRSLKETGQAGVPASTFYLSINAVLEEKSHQDNGSSSDEVQEFGIQDERWQKKTLGDWEVRKKEWGERRERMEGRRRRRRRRGKGGGEQRESERRQRAGVTGPIESTTAQPLSSSLFSASALICAQISAHIYCLPRVFSGCSESPELSVCL
ncbi:hypothetical protein BDV18DRAFT_92064 [Aspergillus unguis]